MSGLNDYQKYEIESSFKNTVKRKPSTNGNLGWYEEGSEVNPRVDSSSLWIDSDYIPLAAPDIAVDEKYSVKIGTTEVAVLEKKEAKLIKVNGTSSTFSSSDLVDSIETSFGTGYNAVLKDSGHVVVPFGLNKWVIDTISGTLTFIDGIPNGYSAPFTVVVYRYIGRKGIDGLLTTDGSHLLSSDYTPTQNKSVATKDYVDDVISKTSSIVEKLIPNTPPTFENKDLIIVSEHYNAGLATSTDDFINTMYNDGILEIKTPQFWNEDEKGFVSLHVRSIQNKTNTDITVDTVSMKNLTEGNILNEETQERNGAYQDTFIKVTDCSDYYKDKIVADDFYKSITMSISLSAIYNIVPATLESTMPIYQIYLEYNGYEINNSKNYKTNYFVIGLDEESKVGQIYDSMIYSSLIKKSYISGVPALVKNDMVRFDTNIATIKKFVTNDMGNIDICDGLFKFTVQPERPYTDFNMLLNFSKSISIPENIYREDFPVVVDSKNIAASINKTLKANYNLRIDSVSDESKRVNSPSVEPDANWSNESFGTFDSSIVCGMNKELQMLNGKYQWPRGNYTTLGLNVNKILPTGPNYDSLISGTRYVTFKFEIPESNGFYFTLKDNEGITYDSETFVLSNIELLKCKILDKTEWLDMNKPYDGVLLPKDTSSKGCMVVNRSNKDTRYATFGNVPISGTLIIVFGIKYNLDIKFSDITVKTNI